jgi:predicted TIM-barrel fold metal-dependent hydrolase
LIRRPSLEHLIHTAVGNIKTMPLDKALRDKILYRNAQRLLKLPATARAC